MYVVGRPRIDNNPWVALLKAWIRALRNNPWIVHLIRGSRNEGTKYGSGQTMGIYACFIPYFNVSDQEFACFCHESHYSDNTECISVNVVLLCAHVITFPIPVT